MDTPRIGFVGCGKMAMAMIRGIISGFVTPADRIYVNDPNDSCQNAAREIGINVCKDNKAVAKEVDMIVVAVKPYVVESVMREIRDEVGHSKLVVSIAAGVTIATLEKLAVKGARVVRVIPNTPCLVKEGAAAVVSGTNATDADTRTAVNMMRALGECVTVKEKQLDAVTGLSGSGPAYCYMMIEAMADGGVKAGLPRDTALRLAAQTLLGSARMVLSSGQHPGALKDEVCSPGGTTIAGVHELERAGFRGAVMNAVSAAADRSREIGKEHA